MSLTDTSLPTSENQAPASTGWSRRKKLAAAGTATALAVVGGGFALTSATFTDEAVVPNNTVGTATLSIGDQVATAVTVANLLPGQTRDAQNVLTFTNDGSVPFVYSVDVVPATGIGAQLAGWIPVAIIAGGQSDTGTLAAPPSLDNLPALAAPLAVAGTATVTAQVGLSSDATNDAQGQSATFDVVVEATQVPTP